MLLSIASVLASLIYLLLFGFVIGLLYPPLIIPWSKTPTRKRVLEIFTFAFLAVFTLFMAIAPQMSPLAKLTGLTTLAFLVVALCIFAPRVVTPWMKEPNRQSAFLFYLPAVLLLVLAQGYLHYTRPVDSRYDIPKAGLAGASEDRLIQNAIAKELRGVTVLNKERIREIEVQKQRGGYTVKVDYNLDDPVFKDRFESIIRQDLAKIFGAVYTGEFDVKDVEVNAYFPTGEKYIDPKYERVRTVSLSGSTAEDIDWKKSSYELETKILPAVWSDDFTHPSFQNKQ